MAARSHNWRLYGFIVAVISTIIALHGRAIAQLPPTGQGVATRLGTVAAPVYQAAPARTIFATAAELAAASRATLEEAEVPAVPLVANPEGPPPGTETAFTARAQSQVIAQPEAAGDFATFQFSSPSSVISSTFKSTVEEPSTGMAGRVMFMTGNWWAAFSNNSGATWTALSPFSQFPSADGGFCCDQTVLYEPSRDMMFWLLQYIKSGSASTSRGRERLAIYRNTSNNIGPSGWIFHDFLPSSFGGPTSGEWFDYPHLALTTNYVYMTVNVFSTTTNRWTRTVIARFPLDALRAGASFSYNYLSWTANFNFTAVQGAKNVMYWASHNSNTSIRIFQWPENTTSVTHFDVTVPAWNTTAHHCPTTNDRFDWCSFSDNRILAAVRTVKQPFGTSAAPTPNSQSELWFFWNVGAGGSFPKPYIEGARFNESTKANDRRPLLWSSSVALHYPGGAANIRGDLALSVFVAAGAGADPSGLLCLADDYTSDPPGWSCPRYVAFGTNGPNNNRWGDFVDVKPNWPSGFGWQATSFVLSGGSGTGFAVPYNIVFGRSRDANSNVRWQLK